MCSANIASTRPYRKTKRALTEAETRQRIVEVTVELHQTVGPAKTTIKAIAERAGVQRATVYNHFPDLQMLFEACNAHYYERHPMPDPTSWVGIAAPNERFRVAVRELYRWYEETEAMLSVGIRDIDAVPPAAMFYDRELASKVARLYAEDFRHYGYSTNLLQLAATEGGHEVGAPAFPRAQL